MVSKHRLSDVRAWELHSSNSTALLRLVRRLRGVPGAGFRLIVLEWNDPRDRGAAIAHVERLFPGAATLQLEAHDPPDFTALLTRLAALAQAHPLVHVLGLENWHRTRPDAFRLLNYRREHIAATCPAAMLFWLIPPDVTRLATEAPDLWSWRTSVLDFTRGQEQPEEIKGARELTGADRQAREARLEQIEAYLGETRATGRSIGRLHREAGDILRALGRWAPARDHLVAAADLFREAGDVRSAAHAERVCANIDLDQGQPDVALDRLRDHLLPLFAQIGDARSTALVQGQIADILKVRGQLDEALRIRQEEELPVYGRLGDLRSKAVTQGKIADILQARGQLDEALRIRQEEQLPVYERLGDVRSKAVTQGKIADILKARGQLDEALTILGEEVKPAFDRLGDVWMQARTSGAIADIFQAHGQLDEALRIRKEEQLPIYERLGDVSSKAVTQGKIADILQARGQLDEALRIRQEEQLPVYERLGDVRSKAVTQGKIADILQAGGQLDEALRIRQEEELPVYERLGDVRELIVGHVNLSLLLLQRGREEDHTEVQEHLVWAYQTAAQRGYQEAGQIADILRQLGLSVAENGTLRGYLKGIGTDVPRDEDRN
jgi:tetratricopeptide (TPR) repeat protein